MLRALCTILLCLGLGSVVHAGGLTARILAFSDLRGWEADDHAAALATFRNTCPDLDDPEWQAICALATRVDDARSFFESCFRPVLVTEIGTDARAPLFTGYFEPELTGARSPSARYRYPIRALPEEAAEGQPWLTRREIETTGVLEARGLEIAWVDNPVEKFFLQVQGSGRIRLAEGGVIRVGYAGKNGHEYRSIGQELVRRGIYEPHEVSAAVIGNWVRRNPEAGADLLYHNASYVFFRTVNEVPPEQGPLGAMNRSVTPLRSIAVDPEFVPLGAPVWVEKEGATPMHRLMIAQDTGSAIRGPQRADIFFGTGDDAGRAAGRLRDPGRMVQLLPIQRAYAMLSETGS